MKTAVISGASGLVGAALTRKLASDHRYESIVLLVRKALPLDIPKVRQVLFDFNQPDPAALKGDEYFCCLGTTIRNAGSQEAFYKVDFQYVVDTARMAQFNGIRKMAVVSAMGADPDSRIFYNRTKGQMEDALSKIPFESLHIMRPSLLLGNRSEYRLGERIAQFFMTRLSWVIPMNYRPISDEQVAEAMIYVINRSKPGIHIHLSGEMASLR